MFDEDGFFSHTHFPLTKFDRWTLLLEFIPRCVKIVCIRSFWPGRNYQNIFEMRYKWTIRVKTQNLMRTPDAFVRLLMLLRAILMLMQITLEIRSAQLLCSLTRNHHTFNSKNWWCWAYLDGNRTFWVTVNMQTAMKSP